MTHFLYLFRSICVSDIMNGLVSYTNIISSMSDCINAIDMLHVTMYLFYLKFMTQDSNIDSVEIVDNLVSSLVL